MSVTLLGDCLAPGPPTFLMFWGSFPCESLLSKLKVETGFPASLAAKASLRIIFSNQTQLPGAWGDVERRSCHDCSGPREEKPLRSSACLCCGVLFSHRVAAEFTHPFANSFLLSELRSAVDWNSEAHQLQKEKNNRTVLEARSLCISAFWGNTHC